jgi:hypothetical protein
VRKLSNQQSARLYLVTSRLWPDRRFDEWNILTGAAVEEALKTAFRPLATNRLRKNGSLDLRGHRQKERRVAHWLCDTNGLTFGGLALERDKQGWCQIKHT